MDTNCAVLLAQIKFSYLILMYEPYVAVSVVSSLFQPQWDKCDQHNRQTYLLFRERTSSI
jgi:hypothetical protein